MSTNFLTLSVERCHVNLLLSCFGGRLLLAISKNIIILHYGNTVVVARHVSIAQITRQCFHISA